MYRYINKTLSRRDRRGKIVIPPAGAAINGGDVFWHIGNEMELAYEGDKQIAQINRRKHNISFYEASTILDHRLAVNLDDPNHSTGENRYLIIGLSDQGKFLFVSYTDRDHIIRLISARLVTTKERRYYQRENQR